LRQRPQHSEGPIFAFIEWLSGQPWEESMVIDRKRGVRESILQRIEQLRTALENAPKSLHTQIDAELGELRREAEQIHEGR
jgi:hypothetical protein